MSWLKTYLHFYRHVLYLNAFKLVYITCLWWNQFSVLNSKNLVNRCRCYATEFGLRRPSSGIGRDRPGLTYGQVQGNFLLQRFHNRSPSKRNFWGDSVQWPASMVKWEAPFDLDICKVFIPGRGVDLVHVVDTVTHLNLKYMDVPWWNSTCPTSRVPIVLSKHYCRQGSHSAAVPI